ncbi:MULTISPECIES: hypothetical protein [Enterococcus]|jgi:hypothetical protein|uniref:hypothetical protein n=1 Tax=Enterococcus TaxID=1350 RepID=UPI0004D8429F|nr:MULTISPECIES: hypothetical protein [Enterococcus]EME7084268.1 hypothetical protein [Enterococcus faecium]EMF0068418.1 hypothetical protein [Enterococcus hirae]EMF0105699.1 hypothetical protein [Enterococcus hirae]EMF0185030.1 hypothetical protein [Enterococcus hirae]EMF0507219.1 hypothetical protein [Enterococcus hirae]
MKAMYEYMYPVGCKVWENMPDDFPEGVPYTSVPPLPDIPLDRQFWNPRERKWEEVVTQDVSKKLNLLEELSIGLQNDNKNLKQSNGELAKKAESLAQINSKTMLTTIQNSKEIDSLKSQLQLSENEGGK